MCQQRDSSCVCERIAAVAGGEAGHATSVSEHHPVKDKKKDYVLHTLHKCISRSSSSGVGALGRQ